MPETHSNQKAWALFISAAGAFFTPFMGSAVNIALPAISRDFHLDAVTLSWIATSYLLAAAVCLVPLGKLADIHGRKKFLAYGLAAYSVTSALAALAPSGGALMAARFLQGAAGAMMFATALAILTSVFPPHERGRALGINVFATYLGLSVGPVAGGWLTQTLGWRSIFWINVPLGLGVLLAVWWKLAGEWTEAAGETLDGVETIWYGASIAGLIYGFSLLPAVEGFGLIAAALTGFGFFIRHEKRAANPILNMNLFIHNRAFASANAAAFINYSATFAVGFLLSLYLQYLGGLSPQQAGGVLIAQPVIMAVFSPLAGSWSDRVEPRLLASLGMGLVAVGLGMLAMIGAHTPVLFVAGSLALLGFGFALFSSPNTNAVMSSVEAKFYGVASATLGTMRLTGQMFSMGLSLLILTLFIGHVPISRSNHSEFLAGLHWAFILFSLLCVVGVFASWGRGKRGAGLKPSQL